MKTLYLMRHAKAESSDPTGADADRQLVKKGKNQTEKVAKKLKKRAGSPDVILSSHALRAVESATIVAKALGYKKKKIVTQEQLYDADPRSLYRIVKTLDDNQNSAMIVGHNPAINDFANSLCKGFNEDLPTSAVVGVNVEVEHWKDLRKGQGVLSYFDFPKKKQKQTQLFKKFKKDIAGEVAESITSTLETIDSDCVDDVKKSVRTVSKKVAKDFVSVLKDNEVVISVKSQENGDTGAPSSTKVALKKKSSATKQGKRNQKAKTAHNGRPQVNTKVEP